MKTKPNNTCPQCGAELTPDAPAGLCPACVMAMNLATPTLIDEDGSERRIRFETPNLEEIVPLFPRLELIELLGQGGMGVVYKARQKEIDRTVALKILPKEIGESSGFAERFSREAQVLGKLNHPNIVTLYEFGHVEMDDGEPLYYFLMEYVDGLNLRRLLNMGRVEAREALSIVPRICDALQYAHDEGIVHRDIKPENILLDRRGNVKVADFGLAKIVGAKEEIPDGEPHAPIDNQQSTIGNSILGTPKYMSPEQIAAPGEVDHRADIFALGVVFYQMLTGEMPDEQLQPPSKKVRIDVRLDEVVLRALEQNPERRYQHASVLKTDVETIESKAPPIKTSLTQAELDQMYRDPANWRLYFFYFCKQDPRIIVPKRISGLGWTFNCANPWSAPFFLVLIGVLMAIVRMANVVGLPGRAFLGVKIALIFGVVWMCHKLSLAREVIPSKTRLRRRVAALAVVALVIGALFVVERSGSEDPRSALEQLASNPQKLRKQSPEKIIAAGLSNISIPWAWKELSNRGTEGELSAEDVGLLVDSFTALMQREHPKGYPQPLYTLGDLFETLAKENMLSEADQVRIRTQMIGAPELAPLPRVVEREKTMHSRIKWSSPWNNDLFGAAQLNRLTAVRVNGEHAEVTINNPSSRNADHLSFSVALPELAPGVYQLECEVETTLVSEKSGTELEPPSIKQWTRTCAAEFSVVAVGAMIASRHMERMDSGGMRYEWSTELRVPSRLCHHSFWLGPNGELVGYWGAVDDVATAPGTVVFSLLEGVVSNKLNYAISRKNAGVGEKKFAMPECDETRTLMLAASESLGGSYTPLWMREFLKNGVVVKTLVFATRLVGDDEEHVEPQAPNLWGIRDYASKMVVVPDTWPKNPPLPEPVSLEFRIASRNAGPGRTEMRVHGGDSTVYVSADAVLTNADVRWAGVEADPYGPRIEIMFTEAGARRFAELTASHLGEPLAILIEGRLVSAPVIMQEISGGRVQIAANFSKPEAHRLAAGLAGTSSSTSNRLTNARKEIDGFLREYAALRVSDNAMGLEEIFTRVETAPEEQPAQLPPTTNNTPRLMKSVTITLSADGTITVDGTPCSAEQLGAELKRIAEVDTGAAVIRADKETSHKQIVTLMDACAAAGIQQLRFAVKESN